MSLGPLEMLLIVGIIVVLFGARKLPHIGRDLGEAIREFRNSGRELMRSTDELVDQPREE